MTLSKSYEIRPAQIEDLPLIMETFIACTSEMRKFGIMQWDYQYPAPQTVFRDIQKGNVFVVMRAGRCIATVTLDEQQDEQYKKINWHHRDARPLIIHRMAVHPLAQGEGLGKWLCEFAVDYARLNGYENIRLDAYSGNPASNKLYQSMGFEKAEGLCYFHGNNIAFYCYEKHLA